MSRVILQPAGSGDASVHYQDTIKNSVPLERIEPYVSKEEINILKEIYDNNALVWGVTPGKDGVNIGKWDRIKIGDVALFSGKGRVFSSSIVTYKCLNRELANELWGEHTNGQYWEYIYFLDELKPLDIPYHDFNKVVGYSPNNIIQGFTVLDERKSRKLIDFYDFESEAYFPNVEKEQFEEAVKGFDPTKPLDLESRGKARTEQNFLRKYLFGNKKTCKCGICGESYPVSFLVAAHIKKRAHCTDEEKLDYKNIVMPMCKFGCDDLYEKGYGSLS